MNPAQRSLLCEWPLPLPTDWKDHVNAPQSEGELEAIRRSVKRGCPYGPDSWTKQVAKSLGIESTLRPRGRPRKDEE